MVLNGKQILQYGEEEFVGNIRTRLNNLSEGFLRLPLPASVSTYFHGKHFSWPARMLAIFVAFATLAAASYGLLQARRAEPALINTYGSGSLSDASFPLTPQAEESTPPVHSESNTKQELTVNGQMIPIPENRKSQRTIPTNDGSNLNVTIDNQQSTTSDALSESTHISTEVHITQEGGSQSQ